MEINSISVISNHDLSLDEGKEEQITQKIKTKSLLEKVFKLFFLIQAEKKYAMGVLGNFRALILSSRPSYRNLAFFDATTYYHPPLPLKTIHVLIILMSMFLIQRLLPFLTSPIER